MIKIIALIFVVATVGCQKLSPETVRIPDYPDYEALMFQQIELLENKRARKEVWLEGQSEVQILEMDSARWAKELSFFKEINPNQPEYIGAFVISGDKLNQTLKLNEGEKGPLRKTTFSFSDGDYLKIGATLHENKDVYVHHREILVGFENGSITELQIDGYQKMMFSDTVRFKIALTIQ